jgi:glycosyltransferase involved in cell wall biosynthesis
LSQALTLIVPGDPDQRTGGYLYDARIVRELRALGWRVDVVGLDGQFPEADEDAARSMAAALAGCPDGAVVIIDGLALGGLPGTVAEHAGRLNLTALVHHPLADETGLDGAARARFLELERRALAACRRVIVTSPFTAKRLGSLGLDERAPRVVEPGVEPGEPAAIVGPRMAGREPRGGERLLCVASLTPRKGQDVLVRALAGLADRDWHCLLAGSTQRDADFARHVAAMVDQAGLVGRVDFIGECDAEALEAAYRRATVSVLPSHYEGYGMVVSESIARGLPMVTTTGGALAETAPGDCCLKVAPDDAGALGDALRRWFDDADLRRRLTQRASERREGLRPWSGAGREFAAALTEAHG